MKKTGDEPKRCAESLATGAQVASIEENAIEYAAMPPFGDSSLPNQLGLVFSSCYKLFMSVCVMKD